MSSVEEKVLKEINQEKLVELLKNIINIPSPSGEEKPLAEYLADYFSHIGLRAQLQALGETSANAVGTLKGDGEGYSLMFNGHLDTTFIAKGGSLDLKGAAAAGVGIEKGFRPQARVEDGRVYGLGAMNMKGALAAYAAAAEALLRSGVQLAGDLVITCVAGEIVYSPVDTYSESWMRHFRFGTFYAVSHGAVADMAIVGEPSNRGLYTGHAGITWAKITTRGKNVNTVYAHELPNPNIRSERIVKALEEWIPEYQKHMLEKYPVAKYHETDLRGPAVRIASVQGGSPWRLARTLPSASVYLDFRTKQPPAELKRELNRFMKKVQEAAIASGDAEFNYEVELYLSEHGGVEIPRDHLLTKTVEKAHFDSFGEAPRFLGQRALDSDAIVLSGYGIPSVNYGPGNPRSFAGVEFVDIEELVGYAKSYALSAVRICNAIAPM